MDPAIEIVLNNWLKEHCNKKIRKETQEFVQSHPEELSEAFGTNIAFGVNGLRAKMGPGPGRMNIYTVGRMIQGMVNYVKTFPHQEWNEGIAICHDSRLHSREFAEVAAYIVASNGIRAHLVPELRPTPFASFACRHLHCIAALNFTASHHPKKYNGCTIYWKDGGQIIAPHDQGIIKEIEKLDPTHLINLEDLSHPLITPIGSDVDNAYLDAIQKLRFLSHTDEEGKKLQIHYSPLHGSGITMIPNALKLWNMNHILLVEAQSKPNGHFPSAKELNPECKEALTLGYQDLKSKQGDLLLVSDPDGDRLSVSILYNKEPISFTGNELGVLLLSYLIDHKKPNGRWATITTIASTSLMRKITEHHGGICFEVLPGFKYIAEKIHQWEAKKHAGHQFLFAMQESLGFLYGNHTRDKDATIAACLTAEMTLHLKRYGKTLLDYLYEIYDACGIHRSLKKTISYSEGSPKIHQIMINLRNHIPHKFAGIRIITVEDYLASLATNLHTKKTHKLDLPKANILLFRLEDESTILIRPSEDEPLLKLYGEVTGQHYPSIPAGIAELDIKLASLLNEIESKHLT